MAQIKHMLSPKSQTWIRGVWYISYTIKCSFNNTQNPNMEYSVNSVTKRLIYSSGNLINAFIYREKLKWAETVERYLNSCWIFYRLGVDTPKIRLCWKSVKRRTKPKRLIYFTIFWSWINTALLKRHGKKTLSDKIQKRFRWFLQT